MAMLDGYIDIHIYIMQRDSPESKVPQEGREDTLFTKDI